TATATAEIYTLSLHDALPISLAGWINLPHECESLRRAALPLQLFVPGRRLASLRAGDARGGARDAGAGHHRHRRGLRRGQVSAGDRKSTRLNSSHLVISYAVF